MHCLCRIGYKIDLGSALILRSSFRIRNSSTNGQARSEQKSGGTDMDVSKILDESAAGTRATGRSDFEPGAAGARSRAASRTSAIMDVEAKKRGRPPGSKNKPKVRLRNRRRRLRRPQLLRRSTPFAVNPWPGQQPRLPLFNPLSVKQVFLPHSQELLAVPIRRPAVASVRRCKRGITPALPISFRFTSQSIFPG